MQTATLLSIKKGLPHVYFFFFQFVKDDYAALWLASTDEGPAISFFGFLLAVALPGNHGAGVRLARRGCSSTKLRKSTVARFKAAHGPSAAKERERERQTHTHTQREHRHVKDDS